MERVAISNEAQHFALAAAADDKRALALKYHSSVTRVLLICRTVLWIHASASATAPAPSQAERRSIYVCLSSSLSSPLTHYIPPPLRSSAFSSACALRRQLSPPTAAAGMPTRLLLLLVPWLARWLRPRRLLSRFAAAAASALSPWRLRSRPECR